MYQPGYGLSHHINWVKPINFGLNVFKSTEVGSIQRVKLSVITTNLTGRNRYQNLKALELQCKVTFTIQG
jgi:hypothetical protein